MNQQEKAYYSVAEAAERYRVTTRTIVRWIQVGYLPGTQKKGPAINSHFEIPASAIVYLDEVRRNKPSGN